MKILIISPQDVIPSIDGGKIGIYMPLKYFTQYHSVFFAFPSGDPNPDVIKKYKKENINAIPLPIIPIDKKINVILNVFQRLPFKVKKYYSSKAQKILESIIINEGIDCIWINHYHMAPYAINISKIIKIPIYLREHNIEYELVQLYSNLTHNLILRWTTWWQYHKSKRFEIKCWKTFNRVYFITKKDYITASIQYPKLEQKSDYIYDGVETLYNTIDVTNREKSFIFSGSIKTFQNKYNLKKFVDDYWILLNKELPELKLYLTGNSDKILEEELKWDNQFLYKYNIINLGFVENIQNTIASRLFFISPTIIGAGLRIKVLEAMSLSMVTFVSPKDYEMCEFFKDNINIVQYTSPLEFVSKTKLILNDTDLQRTIVKNARDTVEKELSWNNYLKKTPFIL